MENKEFNTEGLRNFYNASKDATFYLVMPTAEDIRKADWEYGKAYSKNLLEGIATTAEMMDILTRRGIIGPEFEKRSNELAVELATKIELLKNATNSEEKSELAYKVSSARDELFQWNQRLSAPLGSTCEQMADDVRFEYLTSRLIKDSNGNYVWANYNDYLNEKDQSLAQQSRYQVRLFLQGLESDFLEKMPENIAMRELEAEASMVIAEDLAKLADESIDSTEVSQETETKAKKSSKK